MDLLSGVCLIFVHHVGGLCVCVRVPQGKMLQTVALTCSVLNYMRVAQIEHDTLQTEDGWQKAAMQDSTLLINEASSINLTEKV